MEHSLRHVEYIMCIINFTHTINTIHSFSQACLSFSFLSRKLCMIFLLARFSMQLSPNFKWYNNFVARRKGMGNLFAGSGGI
jgi:hypothetical protein